MAAVIIERKTACSDNMPRVDLYIVVWGDAIGDLDILL